MRLGLVVGVFLSALVFMTSTAEPLALSGVPRAQLVLMPLPRSSYGQLPTSFTLDTDSGWSTNKESAAGDDFRPTTAASLKRDGRVIGYSLEFGDPAKALQGSQLARADSSVDLFRTKKDAARYVDRELSDLRRYEGKPRESGLVIEDVSYFRVPGVKGARGATVRASLGGLTLWSTGVEFPVGVLAASVGLTRTDGRDVSTEAKRLAASLRRRIRDVFANRVHDRTTVPRSPKLGGLGRPRGGPNLGRMAVQPNDFTRRARASSQGYTRNEDAVAEFHRDYKNVTFGTTVLSLLKTSVELRPSAKDADYSLTYFKAALRGKRGLKFIRNALSAGIPRRARGSMRFDSVQRMTVSEGDGSYAYRTTIRFQSVKISVLFCQVRRGPVLESLILYTAGDERIHRIDAVRLARLAVARIDLTLHP